MNFKLLLVLLSLAGGLGACSGGAKNPQKDENKEKTPQLSDLALKGEQIFQANCMQCHLMSPEAMIGPGMVGVTKRVPSKAWAIKFIQNSQSVIKSGDKYALALFKQYKQTPMTSFNFSDEELEALWQYLDEAGK
jgi:cytochrome c2